MKINAVDVASAVQKLFNIKRFASVEYTAKQAFENLNVAMVFLQIALFVAVLLMVGFTFLWWRRRKIKRILNRVSDLFSRLAQQMTLLANSEVLDKASKKHLETVAVRTTYLLSQYVKNGLLKKVVGASGIFLLQTTLDQIADENIARYEKLELIYQTVSWLSEL